MTVQPSTCVIGAGISGLTAGKMLADYGIPYQCFDSSDRIGGNWAFGNPNGHSSAYRSLHIDSSKYQLSFNDYPMPTEYPDFPHHTEIKAYLEDYATAFDLKRNISFNNGVEHAERLPGGGWDIHTQDGQTRRFDAVVVANGHHWDPRFPEFPGTFDGELIHSHQYIDPRSPLDLHKKRILVIGIGNSAADLVSELSHRSHQNTVVLSTRSGAWIVPKYIFGKPADASVKDLPLLPQKWQRYLGRNVPKWIAGNPEDFGLPKPDHNFGDAHPTMSSELYLRLGSGDATAKPNVERFDGSTVHFVDGTAQDFDVVICATGYNITFPFLDPELISAPDNRLHLFKRILAPQYDDLLFAGFVQAAPSLFPFVECQARFIAAYLSGNYRPPTRQAMEAALLADEQEHSGHFSDRPRHTQQVKYSLYEKDMVKNELPQGHARALQLGPLPLAGRSAERALADQSA